MELLNYFLLAAVSILILWAWRLSRESRNIRSNIRKLIRENEILKNRLAQAEGSNLDFTDIENQIEENSQELLSYIQQEVGKANKNIRYLEDRLNEYEKDIDN